MAGPSNAMEKVILRSEEERRKTQECLGGVGRLLVLKTYSTRQQLVQALREYIDSIQAEIDNDQFFADAEKRRVTLFEAQPETFQLPGEAKHDPLPPLVFTRDHSAPGVVYSAPVDP